MRVDICHAHRALEARWNWASDESRRLRCLLPLGARTPHAVPATRLLRLGLNCGPPFTRRERAATQTYLPEGRRRGRTSGWIRVSHLTHSGATLKLRRPRVGIDWELRAINSLTGNRARAVLAVLRSSCRPRVLARLSPPFRERVFDHWTIQPAARNASRASTWPVRHSLSGARGTYSFRP